MKELLNEFKYFEIFKKIYPFALLLSIILFSISLWQEDLFRFDVLTSPQFVIASLVTSFILLGTPFAVVLVLRLLAIFIGLIVGIAISVPFIILPTLVKFLVSKKPERAKNYIKYLLNKVLSFKNIVNSFLELISLKKVLLISIPLALFISLVSSDTIFKKVGLSGMGNIYLNESRYFLIKESLLTTENISNNKLVRFSLHFSCKNNSLGKIPDVLSKMKKICNIEYFTLNAKDFYLLKIPYFTSGGRIEYRTYKVPTSDILLSE